MANVSLNNDRDLYELELIKRGFESNALINLNNDIEFIFNTENAEQSNATNAKIKTIINEFEFFENVCTDIDFRKLSERNINILSDLNNKINRKKMKYLCITVPLLTCIPGGFITTVCLLYLLMPQAGAMAGEAMVFSIAAGAFMCSIPCIPLNRYQAWRHKTLTSQNILNIKKLPESYNIIKNKLTEITQFVKELKTIIDNNRYEQDEVKNFQQLYETASRILPYNLIIQTFNSIIYHKYSNSNLYKEWKSVVDETKKNIITGEISHRSNIDGCTTLATIKSKMQRAKITYLYNQNKLDDWKELPKDHNTPKLSLVFFNIFSHIEKSVTEICNEQYASMTVTREFLKEQLEKEPLHSDIIAV